MINNITAVNAGQQMSVAQTRASMVSLSMPPILGFKTPPLKEKAIIKVKKLKRGDNIAVPGEIDDDYVDIAEEKIEYQGYVIGSGGRSENFFDSSQFIPPKRTRKIKYLKNCYIIDYIQSPKPRCGLGTEAVKSLVEKAFFDSKADGRIVTFSAPMVKEASPAMFFYKLGFRFTSPDSNEFMEECLQKNIPDIPIQTGMMYLPKNKIQKLLRYGDLF